MEKLAATVPSFGRAVERQEPIRLPPPPETHPCEHVPGNVQAAASAQRVELPQLGLRPEWRKVPGGQGGAIKTIQEMGAALVKGDKYIKQLHNDLHSEININRRTVRDITDTFAQALNANVRDNILLHGLAREEARAKAAADAADKIRLAEEQLKVKYEKKALEERKAGFRDGAFAMAHTGEVKFLRETVAKMAPALALAALRDKPSTSGRPITSADEQAAIYNEGVAIGIGIGEARAKKGLQEVEVSELDPRRKKLIVNVPGTDGTPMEMAATDATQPASPGAGEKETYCTACPEKLGSDANDAKILAHWREKHPGAAADRKLSKWYTTKSMAFKADLKDFQKMCDAFMHFNVKCAVKLMPEGSKDLNAGITVWLELVGNANRAWAFPGAAKIDEINREAAGKGAPQ